MNTVGEIGVRLNTESPLFIAPVLNIESTLFVTTVLYREHLICCYQVLPSDQNLNWSIYLRCFSFCRQTDEYSGRNRCKTWAISMTSQLMTLQVQTPRTRPLCLGVYSNKLNVNKWNALMAIMYQHANRRNIVWRKHQRGHWSNTWAANQRKVGRLVKFRFGRVQYTL